jgi:hypothetical protein
MGNPSLPFLSLTACTNGLLGMQQQQIWEIPPFHSRLL